MNLVKPPPAVNTHLPDRIESDPSDPYSELLPLIEVGASCFIHYCISCVNLQLMSYTMSTGV